MIRAKVLTSGPFKNQLITAKMYLHRIGKQPPYFSMTAEIEEDMVGCLHDETVEVWPDLRPLVKWHLCEDGIPMHYVANAVYWCELEMGISPFQLDMRYSQCKMEIPRGYGSFLAVALSHARCEALDDAKEFEERFGAWRCQRANGAPQSGCRDFEEWLKNREPRLVEEFRKDMAKFGITETL